MKLTFLGTGSSEGIPAFRCGCLICSEAREKKGRFVRQNSSLLAEPDTGGAVLVDMPAHIMASLEKYRVDDRTIDSIFFTHYHIDHTGGIFHLLESNAKNGHVPVSTVKVYMPHDFHENVMAGIFTGQADISRLDTENYFSLHAMKDLEKVSCLSMEVQALDTNHLAGHAGKTYKRECHGYLFSEDGKRAAYMVDSTPALPEPTLSALRGRPGGKLDCLIFECTFDSYPDSGRGHSDHEGVFKIRDILKPERMILTHISHRNCSHEKLSELMESHGIEVAWDGMQVSV